MSKKGYRTELIFNRPFYLFFFLIFLIIYSCESKLTELSESDISDDYAETIKNDMKKLITTGQCTACVFNSINLSKRFLQGKNLSSSKFIKANFAHSNLSNINLSRANLTRSNLIKVNMTNANLVGVNLTGANLTESNMEGANLTGANLTGTNLDSAIKCKTIFSWGEDNSGCKQKTTKNFLSKN